MFFSLVPQIVYDSRTIVDISNRVNIISELLDNEDFYFNYDLKTGDLIETLAYDFYGDSIHQWILILINQVYDPFYDWYMTEEELIEFAKLEYGDPDYLTGIHHYVDADDIKYADAGVGRLPITNIEYEIEKNDARRTIKVVYPEYVEQFLSEYRTIIEQ
jgi:hypothetical protein